MTEKASPERFEYDRQAEHMDRAWAEMISDRLQDPETQEAALAELENAKAESAESRVDSVTGLGNHRGFFERLDLAHAYAARHRSEEVSFHVDVIDVRGLNTWNQSPDQSTGDTVLRIVAGALRAVSQRGTDYAARVGGDEFAIIRENGNPDETFITKLRDELDKPANRIDGKPVEVYVGGASWEGTEPAEAVYMAAQKQMSLEKGQFPFHRTSR